MQIRSADLSPRDAYRLLIACVVPRPIAWVSTVDAEGRANLAPFSFFGGVTARPPTVVVSVGWTKGRRKDTAANLLATGEAVVHLPPRPLAEKMVATSAEAAPGEDEFELAGLTKARSVDVRPPRVADAPLAMEARVAHHMPVGEGPTDLFLLEVVRFHLRDDVLRDGLPDPRLLDAVGRLGGSSYCTSTEVFDIPRPS